MPRCAMLCHPAPSPAAGSGPQLLWAQHGVRMETPRARPSGRRPGASRQEPSRPWFVTAQFQNSAAAIGMDNRKKEIYGDAAGDEALARRVAVRGMVLDA